MAKPRRSGRWATLWAALLVAALAGGAEPARDPLIYQPRDGHWEGIRREPTNASGVELWSALLETPSLPALPELPDELTLGFYLPQGSQPHLVVQEIDNRFYYRLDRVEATWLEGDWNEFSWSADAVLKPIAVQYHPRRIDLPDLGALVRLDRSTPSIVERVAPATWAPMAPTPTPSPTAVSYVFTFLGGSFASGYRCKVYPEGVAGSAEPVYSRPLARIRPGVPFSCRWRPGDAAFGQYRLVIEDGEEVAVQTVVFEHVDPAAILGDGQDG